MARSPSAIPLRPDYSAVGLDDSALIRAVIATAKAHIDETNPGVVLRSLWPDDDTAGLVLRAATEPASTIPPGWGSSLAGSAIVAFTAGLGAASSQLLRRAGTKIAFDRAAAVSLPAFAVAPVGAFIAQGSPIPVAALSGTPITLGPRKIGIIVELTRELFEHSLGNIEAVVRTALGRSAGLTLDSLLLDNIAGDAVRPAGLKVGVAALPASASAPGDAMIDDLSDLIAAVGAVSGNGPVAIVAAPKQAAAMRLRFGTTSAYEVFSSTGLAAGEVGAVALNALVAGLGSRPRFEMSKVATFHREDATPLAIGTPGAPPTIAAPTSSTWQVDGIALKLVIEISWGVYPGAFAWTSAVVW